VSVPGSTSPGAAWKRWLVDYHAAIVESDLDASARWIADVAAHRADNETGKVNLRRKGMSARKLLAVLTDLSERTVTRKLTVLEAGGWVRREGERRGGSYFDLWVLPRPAGHGGAMRAGHDVSATGHGGAAAGQNGATARHGGPHVFSGVFSDDSSRSVARDARGEAGEVEQSSPRTLVEWDQRFRRRLRGPHRNGQHAYPLPPEKAYNRLVKRHGLVPASFSSQEWEALMVCASLLSERSDIVQRAQLLLVEQQGGNGR
jgi:DNA-binding transcriptional ArsR family regulator